MKRIINYAAAFTLVEVLVSAAVVVLITVMMVNLTNQTIRTLSYTVGKAEQFREARNAFESLTQRLSQATLNTYWDYDYGGGGKLNVERYSRRSELRFVCAPVDTGGFLGEGGPDGAKRVTHAVFFHAPLGVTDYLGQGSGPSYKGLENLINAWGYFVEYSDDRRFRPRILNDSLAPPRWRFRLMSFMPATENLRTYAFTSGWKNPLAIDKQPNSADYRDMTWFVNQCNQADPPTRVVAENVIALILTPRLPKREEERFPEYEGNPDVSPLAPDYIYDSSPAPSKLAGSGGRYSNGRTNPVAQLPPVVQVTMVAIDEASAIRLGFGEGDENKFGLASSGSGKFKATSEYSKDLRLDVNRPYGNPNVGRGGSLDKGGPLENTLAGGRVSYRVFTTNVALRGAKWSRAQNY